MTTNKRKSQFEILEETINFYNLSNRAVQNGICVLLTADNKMCALGRCMENPECGNLGPGLNANLSTEELDTMLKPEYRGHPVVGFWTILQGLHDNGDYWTDTGLSLAGKQYIAEFFPDFKLKGTSQEWYDLIKHNPHAITSWLKNQYHGEVTAAERIRSLILCYTPPDPAKVEKYKQTVELIAQQEEDHAKWVGELLRTRGITPEKLVKPERYWENVIPQISDWETGCAVAAHAEEMRLDRIRVICADDATAPDIKDVFSRILVQEEFHAKAFREFTTDEAMQKTLEGHLAGLNELGLKP